MSRAGTVDEVNEARRSWYYRNQERQKVQSVANKRRYIERNVRIVKDAKDRPCMDCSGSFPGVCMDFDHLDPTLKVNNVSLMARRPVSEARLLAEMAKCEVVCSNCHRMRTARRDGWSNL